MLCFIGAPLVGEVRGADIIPIYQMGERERAESSSVNYFVPESHHR